jgi:hypothetical protein
VSIPELIAACQRDEALPFLVVGGHAVIAHGHARFTYDLDLLVRRSQRDAWVRKLESLGYTVFREHTTFVQMAPSGGGTELDLMLVTDETFAGLWAAACSILIAGVEAKMPSLKHLIALKLHVLKQGLAHRTVKDLDDVIMLVLKNGLDIRTDECRNLFLRYGTADVYEKALRATGRG